MRHGHHDDQHQAGGALGVAVLGSLLSQVYLDRLDVSALPAQAADVARDSIAGAVGVAARVGNPALASSAQSAYIEGMQLILIVCGHHYGRRHSQHHLDAGLNQTDHHRRPDRSAARRDSVREPTVRN